MSDREPYRSPFRGKFGERVVDGLPWLVGAIDEECDGWPHRLIGSERNEIVRFRWTFDQHNVRQQALERTLEAPGGARPVMADAEDVHHAPYLAYCSTGAVQVLPPVALLHDRLEILEPDHPVLHRVLDHGA